MTKLDSDFKSNLSCVRSWEIFLESLSRNCLYETRRIFLFEFVCFKHTSIQCAHATHAQNTWFQLNMCTIYLFIYFSISIFSSIRFYSSYYTNFIHILLNVIPNILYFWCYYKCYLKISIVGQNISTKRQGLSD